MRTLLYTFMFLAAALPLMGNENIDKLSEGNKRFIKGDIVRQALVASQHPFCAVVACSDSRVAPEVIFDQGLGELFVVRLAGNVASPEALDSLDFACNVLNVDLIVVLGHENCGAVQAVMEHSADKELGALGKLIEPAVKNASSVEEAIIANVKEQMKIIKNDPDLQKNIQAGSLSVVGAVYHFDTGLVTFLQQ